MNKIVQQIVTLLLVLLLTCGMFPSAFATDAAPEDTTTEDTLSAESDAVPMESNTEPTESTEPVEPLSPTEPSEPVPPATEDREQDATFTEETVTASPIFFDTGSAEDTPMLMAMDDCIMLAAANNVTGTHYQRAIVWLTGGERINFTYKGKDYSVSRLYTHGVIVNGKRYVAYCMQEALDRFYEDVRRKRKRKHYTQRNLADRLHVSLRTIMDIENGHTVPRLDTVIALCLELDLSLDAVIFPHVASSAQSKSASDFLAGKSERELQKYVALCQLIDELYSDKTTA